MEVLLAVIVVLAVIGYIGKLLASGSAREAGLEMQADSAGCLSQMAEVATNIVGGACGCYTLSVILVVLVGALIPFIGTWALPLVIVVIAAVWIGIAWHRRSRADAIPHNRGTSPPEPIPPPTVDAHPANAGPGSGLPPPSPVRQPPTFCPRCGFENAPEGRYCAECGRAR